MLSRRSLLLISLLIVVGGGLLVWRLWLRTQAEQAPTPPLGNTPMVNAPNTNVPRTPEQPPSAPGETDNTLPVKVVGMRFAEVYGTYSTDLPFQNVRNVRTQVTAGYRARLDASLNSSQPPNPASFYSVTTRALVAEVTALSGETALVRISTQREELFDRDGEARLSYQTLSVELERVDGSWLVANAAWETNQP